LNFGNFSRVSGSNHQWDLICHRVLAADKVAPGLFLIPSGTGAFNDTIEKFPDFKSQAGTEFLT
jgi:hypothetical protein